MRTRPSALRIAWLCIAALLGASVIASYAALLNNLALSEETLLAAAGLGVAFGCIYALDLLPWGPQPSENFAFKLAGWVALGADVYLMLELERVIELPLVLIALVSGLGLSAICVGIRLIADRRRHGRWRHER
jgi:hypothetical protein